MSDWKLYIGGHRGTEGSAFVDMPRPCWSRPDARRILREVTRKYQKRGCGIWFARAENGDQLEWLVDNRGTLR